MITKSMNEDHRRNNELIRTAKKMQSVISILRDIDEHHREELAKYEEIEGVTAIIDMFVASVDLMATYHAKLRQHCPYPKPEYSDKEIARGPYNSLKRY